MGTKRLKDETKHHPEKIWALSKGHAKGPEKLPLSSKKRLMGLLKLWLQLILSYQQLL